MRNKQISGGIILSALSQVIGISVSLAYTPVMIRILGQSEYGLYQLVQSVVSYLTLMNIGFNGAYVRYYAIARSKNDEGEVANINGMFFSIFAFLAGAMIVGGGILFANIGILGDNLTAADYVTAKKLLVIMVASLALSMPNSLFAAYIFANERFVFSKVVGIIVNLLIPVLNLPLLLLGLGSVGMASVSLLLSLAQFATNVVYCVKKLNLRIHFGYFNKDIFKDLFTFTFFIFLSDLVDQLNTNVDKLLLGRLQGTVAVAVYSVAFNLKYHFTTITWLIPEMYVPQVNLVAVEENADVKLNELFVKIGRYNNFIVLLVITGFILCGRQFIHLWVGTEYDTAYYAAVILMLSGYIPAVQTLGVNIQNAKFKHKVRSIVYLCVACMNVVASVFLIQRWGVIGTCLGTLFAMLLGSGVFMNYYYHKHVGLNVFKFWKEILKSAPYSGITVLLGLLILRWFVIDSWMKFIIFVGIYTVIYCALLFALGLKKEERGALLGKLKRKKEV